MELFLETQINCCAAFKSSYLSALLKGGCLNAMVSAVLRGCFVLSLFKRASKSTAVTKADSHRDFINGEMGFCQQFLGEIHS